MQDAPKIVRERLRVTTSAVNHPDADVLTAFSERSLPQLERDIVLEHLARCGDCRDVVALALPVTESVETPANVPSWGWLAWPALRWGFVAVGILAIGSLGIVQYQRRSEAQKKIQAALSPAANTGAKNETEAKNEALAVPAVASPAQLAKERDGTRSLPAATPAKADKKSSADVPPPQAPPPPASAQPSSGTMNGRAITHTVMGRTVGGPLVANQFANNQWQQNSQTNAFQVPTPAPAAPKSQLGGPVSAGLPVASTVAVNGQPSQVDVQSQDADGLTIESEKMPQQSADEGYAESKVAKSKPADTVFMGASKTAIRSAPAAFDQLGGGPTLAMRWTISSAGGLQRSVDQGNTWQDVSVSAAPGSPAGAQTFETFTPVPAVRAKAAAKDAKADKLNVPITFRAVAANGPDVWAGGSGGLLYHSTDAGGHWTRITPSTGSGVLTGDIISLEFLDGQHGKVSTSTSEIWTTSDAGQSWQKQP